eukprot:986449-Prorocentrum_minimum.AAC.4
MQAAQTCEPEDEAAAAAARRSVDDVRNSLGIAAPSTAPTRSRPIKVNIDDRVLLSTVGRRSSQKFESWSEGPSKSRQSPGSSTKSRQLVEGRFPGPTPGLAPTAPYNCSLRVAHLTSTKTTR